MQLLTREGHTVSHNSKRHYHDAFVAMSRMRQRGLLCDIVLHVATKEIRAHKVVLASCSPYFHAMFTSKCRPARGGSDPVTRRGSPATALAWPDMLFPADEMSESRQTHITLHDIDPQALDQLVQFAYTAEIVVGEGNVQVRRGAHGRLPARSSSASLALQPTRASLPSPCPPQTLLPAASLLQLNGVRDACCKFLLSQLDPSNCLGIRGFADTHSCSDLLKAAHRYVLQHFVDVAKTEEFMLLPLKQVTPPQPDPTPPGPLPQSCQPEVSPCSSPSLQQLIPGLSWALLPACFLMSKPHFLHPLSSRPTGDRAAVSSRQGWSVAQFCGVCEAPSS